ncbi:pilus assembly protein TadG-related protein [uncultured Sphingomonas sp.]|uniref:pilus assembly protein TadG-related protein n=1 Tax=uncultured Sphingomonas sp. TaxID=158754 RepID=UPI0035CB6E5B
MGSDFPSTWLGRLARDRRGNTIAIMAAMMVPMAALAGSAIDVSRLYLVKARLQQACDAGVLAGRKFMTGTGTTLDPTATTQANAFFTNNFATGWLSTSNTAFTPAKTSDSQVSGTAVTTVPMTIMKMFGAQPVPLNVTCQARFDVADTDVIFVLDTTGSMSCLPQDSDATCTSYVNSAGTSSYSRPSSSDSLAGYAGTTAFSVPEKSGSRIEALRKAVLSFYDAFASAADPSTHVRYGFVTYTSSVNAGKAVMDVIPNAMMSGSSTSDMPNYESRHVYADYTSTYSDSANGKTNTQCTAFVTTRTPSTALTYNSSSGTATEVSNIWSNSKCYTRTKTLMPQWEYKQLPFDVTALVNGNTVINPTKVHGQTMRWLGCIETLVDTPGQTSFSATSPPSEIDPDVTPTGSTRWIPQMQDLVYERNVSGYNGATDYTNGDEGYWNGSRYVSLMYGSDPFATAVDGSGNRVSSDADYLQKAGAMACGKPVKRLGVMSRSDVVNWVYATDFVPIGGTYHDTGMIWGARLLSPTGPWATDTAAWAGRNAPNRVIIFLTDGDMAPSSSSYSMYGEEGYDRRVSGTTFGTGDPSGGKNPDGTCTNTSANCYKYIGLHNNRFLAACATAKAHNIDIWTVSIDTSVSAPLQACATNASQALNTTDGSGLGTIFASIAQKLAMLRLSQ